MSLKSAIRKKRMKNLPKGETDIRTFIADHIEQVIEDLSSDIESKLNQKLVAELKKIATKLKKGEKGDKGDAFIGSQGPQGVPGIGAKGKDGHTPTKQELLSLIQPLIPAPVKGEDGKDAPELTSKQLILKINEKEEVIQIKSIKGLDAILKNHDRAIREKGGSRQKKHGGGMTLVAGSNVTLVRNSDGTWTIASTGGGTIATEVVTAVTSGSNVTIDLTQLSSTSTGVKFVSRNGQVLMPNGSAGLPGSSWSQSGSVVTVYNADSSDIYLIQYSHA